MADEKSLYDLFIENLRRAYDAEKQLVKALPHLRDGATSEDLIHAFQTHIEESELHVSRLEQIFEWCGEPAKTHTCEAMKGILEDGEDLLDLDVEPDLQDAALIAAAQEAEHFEIALYGTLRTWAMTLGKNDAMQALELTLEEEKAGDSLLTGIAATLNARAAHAHTH